MRLTYQDLRYEHYRAINLTNTDGTPKTDTNIDNNFNMHLGQRYQLILAKMANYKTIKSYSFSTSSSTQIYPFPPGLVTIEGGWIQVGSVKYPLQPIESRYNWEQLNAIQIQASALPQFYFVEQDSFQIWPIPQATYSGVIYYHYRDRNLSVNDYSTGTITVTNGSATITGSGVTFTKAMVGRWFTVTDPTSDGQGYWFRVTGFTDSSNLTVGTNNGQAVNYPYTTGSGYTYRIGETPEIPEEGHVILSWGTASDYYAAMRKDMEAGVYYDNLFYTGAGNNNSRDFEDRKIMGGLIGLVNSYRDRDDRTIVRRRPKLNPLQYKVFATTLS